MKNYIIFSTTTMKPYNRNKYWIDGGIIPEFTTNAEDLEDVINKFTVYAEKHGVEISKHAIKEKQPMFRDFKDGTTKIIGFVITGKTYIDDYRAEISYRRAYVDIWAEIYEVTHPAEFNKMMEDY